MYNKKPLNAEELNIVLPILIKLLKTTNRDNPLKAYQIVEKMNSYRIEDGKFNQVFSEPTLRRMANHIRGNSLLPLIADNTGYWVSYDYGDIDLEINSLEERIKGLKYAIDGLKYLKQQLIINNIKIDPFGFTDWVESK